MAVYVVVRPSKLLSKDVRYMEDVGGGMVQPVTMAMDNGRYQPYRNFGLVIPRESVRNSLLRIQKHEIDERGLRG